MRSALPEPFGPYLLLRPLGRGGMGVVYVARSRQTDHPLVALKRLRADSALVPSFKERFEHECALALRLQHPRLVQALDAGEVDGVPYVASELIVGQDVGAISERLLGLGRGAPVKVATRLMIDMLAGLDYVHQAHEPTGRPLRLVHRDVTPGNVLVGYDGFGRLADFGLAKSLLTEQLQLTATGTILGTPKFLAPEVALGEAADLRSDLYGLGAVIYRLLVGRGPYDGEPRAVLEALLSGPPRPLDALRPDLPPWFSNIIARLMARDPKARPASAREAGLLLVEESRRHDSILPRAKLGQWLKDLFADEWVLQTEALAKDRKVDIARIPVGEGTRVLEAPASPLEGPHIANAAAEEPVDDDGRTLRPKDIEAARRREDIAWRPDPAAPTEVADLVPDRESATGHASTPSRPAQTRILVEGTSPAAQPTISTPPGVDPDPRRSPMPIVSPSPAMSPPLDAVTGEASRRDWLGWVAFGAVALLTGSVIGISVSGTSSVDKERFALVERLGRARQAAGDLRARGIDIPGSVDARLLRVKQLLLSRGDLTEAQVELQEIELILRHHR